MILPVFPIVSLSVAFLFALVTTPIARRFALAIGLMDNPDTHRKLHREPIAICGGIAILFSLLGTLVVCLMAYPAFVSISMGHMYEAMSLALEGEPGGRSQSDAFVVNSISRNGLKGSLSVSPIDPRPRFFV